MAAIKLGLDQKHSDSIRLRNSAFEAEVAKADGRPLRQNSGGGQRLISLLGKLDYILVSETEISELQLTLGWKNDEDGKKHHRTFIHDGSLEDALGYLNEQRKLNCKFVVQSESVIEDGKGGYLSATHQELNAFHYNDMKKRAEYWGISRIYAILRGIGLALQYLCKENSSHGNLKNGIFFDKNDHVFLHRFTLTRANDLSSDMRVFHNIVGELADVANNKKATTKEETRQLEMISVYNKFLTAYLKPNQVSYVQVQGTNNWKVRVTTVKWNFMLLLHFFFWDDRNCDVARFLRNLHQCYQQTTSIKTSTVFKAYINTFRNWESRVECWHIGKKVLQHMNQERPQCGRTPRTPVEVIEFCNNFVKHYTEQAEQTRSAKKGESQIIDELLEMFPNFLKCMYEAYVMAVGCMEYSVQPESMLLHNI